MVSERHFAYGRVEKIEGKWRLNPNSKKAKNRCVNILKKNGEQPKNYLEARDIASKYLLENYSDNEIFELAILAWEHLIGFGYSNKSLEKLLERLRKKGKSDRQIETEIIVLRMRKSMREKFRHDAKEKIGNIYRTVDGEIDEVARSAWYQNKYRIKNRNIEGS